MSKHGGNIKNLRLGLFYNSAFAFKMIRQKILKSTPRLESLTLNFPLFEISLPSRKKSRALHSEPSTLSLENLQELFLGNASDGFRSIESQDCRQFVGEILSAASNLRRISDLNLCFTREIVAAGKINAVYQLILFGNREMMVRFEEFAHEGPTLKRLQCDASCFPSRYFTPPAGFPEILSRILKSSQRTLQTLQLYGRLDLTIDGVSMEIPVMESLEELSLEQWGWFRDGRGLILPPKFCLELSFPKLKVLKFESSDVQQDNDNLFDHLCNSSTKVEQLFLSLWIGPNSSLLVKARNLYPNVRVLNLKLEKGWEELLDICKAIWKSWSDSLLEELSIKLVYGYRSPLDINFAEKMDSALKGFDQETCKMLRESVDSDNDQGEQDFPRDFGILDMKKLKLFQLTRRRDRTDGFPLFSRVSKVHALEPMSKRQNFKMIINGVRIEDLADEGPNINFSKALYLEIPSLSLKIQH